GSGCASDSLDRGATGGKPLPVARGPVNVALYLSKGPAMKPLIACLLLALAAAPALATDVDVVDTSFVKAQGPHPFNVRDLVMMDRVSDPQLSPDGRYAAFGVRSTDYAAN